jgi:hypothetical protein
MQLHSAKKFSNPPKPVLRILQRDSPHNAMNLITLIQ